MADSDFSARHPFKHSIWHEQSGDVSGSPFVPDASFDVAVIGGGVAGAVAALRLVRGGARVALLEREQLAAGATGRSAGFVVPAFSVVRPKVLTEAGEEGARLLRLVSSSADHLFSLAHAHAMHSDAIQRGWFQPARSLSEMRRVEQDVAVWRSMGASAEILGGEETYRRTGVSGYAGALFAPRGGTVNPVRFVEGLVRAAMQGGLQYFPVTEAQSMTRRERRWKIVTPRGLLSADNILLCANARSNGLTDSVDSSVIPLRICQIATAPLGADERHHLLGQGQGLSDLRKDIFTYRFDARWRLISGGMPVLPVCSGQRVARNIATRLRHQLGLETPPVIERVWFGEASVTADRIPAIHQLGPGAYSMTACNGRGLASSTAISELLAAAMISGSFAELPMPVRQPVPIRQRRFQTFGARLYSAYGQIHDALRL